MLLAYLDESYTADRYFIAALVVPDDQARPLTAALNKIVEDLSWDVTGVRSDTELHAYDLVNGKGDWSPLKKELRRRIGVYNDVIQAAADHDITVLRRGVDVPGLAQRYGAQTNPQGFAHTVVLTHLTERIDELAAARGLNALMIADEVDGQADYRSSLAHYQQHETWGYRARKIERVVDTIHFAPSHASRLQHPSESQGTAGGVSGAGVAAAVVDDDEACVLQSHEGVLDGRYAGVDLVGEGGVRLARRTSQPSVGCRRKDGSPHLHR